ncbi:hypothetical protein [Moraxella oblonga]|uniref:hypothetical protein n=1 Tax=Moraxella oblonga TaxID=200413 RepID=UPI00082F2B14|nr:hypothetical protein [Moraxella oblonga]
MSKIIKSLSVLTISAFLLSGCASMLVDEMTNRSPKDITLFQDEFVAIGKPSQPISGFNNVLILASPKNSLIVELENKDYHLFNQLVPQLQSGKINNQHLNLSSDGNEKGIKLDKQKQIHRIQDNFLLQYWEWSVPKDSYTQKELTKMGFRCTFYKDLQGNPKTFELDSALLCEYKLTAKLTLANAVKNSYNLTHQFKQPFKYHIYYTKNNNVLKATGLILTPVAFAVDLVTLPIHIATVGIFIPRLPDR